VTDRIRTGSLTLRSYGAFGAIRTRGLLLTEETLLPLELRRRELGKRDSDAHLKVPKTCGIPVTPFPTASRVQVSNPPPRRYRLRALAR
jgi:hypothetical protein